MKNSAKFACVITCLMIAAAQATSQGDAPKSDTASRLQGTPFFKHVLSDEQTGSKLNTYLAPGSSPKSPLLVMVQGSGCDPVFTTNSNGQAQSRAGQDIVTALSGGRYSVLIVDKPHVETSATGTGGQQDGCSQAFRRDHSLDKWTSALSASIDQIKQEHAGAPDTIRVLGLSEGALVAARLTSVRSDVSHVAFISSFGCHQIDDMLVAARRDWIRANPDATGEALQNGVAEAVAEAEAGFKTVFENPADYDTIIFGQTPQFWSTFGLACPADDLSKSDAGVFVAYGTADEQIAADGIEEIISRRLVAGKTTKAIRIVDGNHVLASPSEAKPFDNLIGVLQSAIDWMEERPGN